MGMAGFYRLGDVLFEVTKAGDSRVWNPDIRAFRRDLARHRALALERPQAPMRKGRRRRLVGPARP
jgi:hypothetical protein